MVMTSDVIRPENSPWYVRILTLMSKRVDEGGGWSSDGLNKNERSELNRIQHKQEGWDAAWRLVKSR